MGLPIPDFAPSFTGGPSQSNNDAAPISNEGYTGAFSVGSGQARQTNAHPVTNTDTSSGPSQVPNYAQAQSFFSWPTVLAVGAVIVALVIAKSVLKK